MSWWHSLLFETHLIPLNVTAFSIGKANKCWMNELHCKLKVLLENTIIFCLPQWLDEFLLNILTIFFDNFRFVLLPRFHRILHFSNEFHKFKRIISACPKKKHFYFCYCDGWGSGIAAWSRESNPKWAVNENKKVEFQKIEKFVINVKSIEIDLK